MYLQLITFNLCSVPHVSVHTLHRIGWDHQLNLTTQANNVVYNLCIVFNGTT